MRVSKGLNVTLALALRCTHLRVVLQKVVAQHQRAPLWHCDKLAALGGQVLDGPNDGVALVVQVDGQRRQRTAVFALSETAQATE